MHVILENDTKKREVIIPEQIEEALKTADVLELFLKQPDYIKREQINHIEFAKKEETRINRINALVKQLNQL